MIENVQHEVKWAQAARKVSQRASEMAEAEHITLTDMKWHRGHEVADLDGWWLTLITDNRAITERFPNEWLEALGNADDDQRVVQRLSRMVQALIPRPEFRPTQISQH
jgi:hypothetical protein